MCNKEKHKYAREWNESAKFFYENREYDWMCHFINDYFTVLEVGCGTGYSTLALLENGHKVVAIEKNQYCIEKAQQLITSKGYTYDTSLVNLNDNDVVFLDNDISDKIIFDKLNKDLFDVVICWNIGSYWTEEMINFYLPKLLEYGLTIEQIIQNPESSYSEYLIWITCRLANEFSKPVHLIERLGGKFNEMDKTYYNSLKDEFSFSQIRYENKNASTKSTGGRVLSLSQKQCKEEILEIILGSILYDVEF